MKRQAIGIGAALMAATLLAGCSGGGGGGSTDSGGASTDTRTVAKGGDAVIAMAGDIDFLDPALVNFTPARQVLYAICERLYEVQTDGSFEPQLAAAPPEISDDGLTVTVPLREDVVFNDGTPFNAEAVKKNIDRSRTWERSVRTIAKSVIKSVDVVDDYTVQLTLNYNYSPILAELGDYTGIMASPAQLDKMGDEFSADPVCVGPFEFSSRAPGDNIKVTKSEQYYDKDAVNLDSITFKVISDANARAANVESGDVDMGAVAEPVFTRLKNSPQVKAIKTDGIGYNGVTFNVGNVAGVAQPYGEVDNVMAKNPKLREAFNLALDRDAINQAVFNGENPAQCSPIPSTSIWSLDIECPEPDIDRAKQLVQESGVPTPIKLTFHVPNTPDGTKLATVVQSMVKEAGFEMEIIPGETLATITNGQAGNFVTLNMGWIGRYEPHGNIQFDTGDANNYAGYSNPEVDALLKKATETFDPEERKDFYRQAVELFAEDNVYLYINGIPSFWISNKDFIVPQILGDGTMKVKTAGFAES